MNSPRDSSTAPSSLVAALTSDDHGLLVDSVVDYAIFMLDLGGNVATWNRGAERIEGYRADEIIGSHFSRFFPPEDVAAGKPEQELKTARDLERVEDEGWRLRKDGTRFWANVVLTALRDENGTLRGYGKVVRDLSGKRDAEERLRRSEERFHHLVDAITDYAVFLLDATGHVATWNPGAQRIKGYAPEEIVGKHFSLFYTAEDSAAGKPNRILETVRSQGRFEEESWRVRKDGSRFWANVVITALRGENGEVTGFAKVTRDLTARRLAEENERKLAEERLARAAADDERRRLLMLLGQVPAVVNYLRGPNLVFEFAHPKAIETMGGRALAGKPLLEAVPEMVEQPYYQHIRRVYETGEPFEQHESLVWHELDTGRVESYWNSVYLPIRDASGKIEGVMTFDLNVSEGVKARRELERANHALHGLMELAIALSTARTPEEVCQAVMDRGMRAADADTCAVYLLDEEKGTLELIGHRGVDERIVGAIRRITRADAPSTFQAVEAGAAVWVETALDYERLYPHLAKLEAGSPRARSFWSVPLVVEGRAIGLLGMGYYESQQFSPERRSFVDTLANQCAQALLRAVRMGREDRALAWFSTTLRSIGDAVIATDTLGNVTLMNAVAEGLTGWTEAEARGRRLDQVFAIFSEETGEPGESPVTKVLREGQIVGLANHTVLRAKSGSHVPIDDSAAPIRDPQGELLGVVLVFRDVSERKRNDSQRDFLARAGAVLASSLDYRETLSAAARLVVPQLADWCRVDLLEAGTLRPIAVAHSAPEKVAWAQRLDERYPVNLNAQRGVANVVRTGTAELYPVVTKEMLESSARDSEHLGLLLDLQIESVMIVPLLGRGRVLGALTLISAGSGRHYDEGDLAFIEEFARRAAMSIENGFALKQAEAAHSKEEALRKQADQANRTKDEFLALVSHELRTPLNAIVGWTQILRAKEFDPATAKAIEVIHRNAQAQARIIDDILDVSRIVTGKLKLDLKSIDLVAIVAQAVDVVRPSADAKGIAIEFAPDEVPCPMVGDPERLQQVAWNLLSNAVKFTNKGGRIQVAIERRESALVVSVADSGAGIDKEFLPHVFQAFRQADASSARRVGGLGLGLALVRHIVELHGGTVHADSAGLGRGATFSITLPVRALAPVANTIQRAPSASVPAHAVPALSGLRVLVVDDDDDARELIAQILTEGGAIVGTAASASEGFDSIRNSPPQILISDIGMPGEDGFSFIRRVRSLGRSGGGAMPAIALTAYTRHEDRTKALAAGFTTHIGKPVNPDDLVAAVANLALYA